jgi:mRNA interferase MazF
VVLSLEGYNTRVGMMVCCPVTNQSKGYPFEVRLPHGLRTSGVVLSDQLKSVDWRERAPAFIEKLPNATVADILRHSRAMISDT